MDSFLNFITAIPYFVILIGILIFVHEGGHFLFAKLFKVKVHVFSLGFGPKLLGFRRGETLYKISAVPIGGYVKMLGEDPTEVLKPEDKGRAFGDKPKWQRFLIIIGGPVTNLIFPLFLYFGVGLSFDEIQPPEVGMVMPGMPAHGAGIKPGDTVISVNGEEVYTFKHLVALVSPKYGQKVEFKFRRGGEILTRSIVPEKALEPVIRGFDEMKTVGRIGVGGDYLPSVVGVGDPSSVAGLSGLESFDLVVKANGKSITRLLDLENQVIASAGGTVVFEVQRFKKDAKAPFYNMDEQFETEPRTVSLVVPPGVSSLGEIGIETTIDYVAYITPGGAAEKIGLQRGDKLVSLDGKKYSMGKIYAALSKTPDKASALGWTRQGQKMESSFQSTFIPASKDGALTADRDRYDNGFWGFLGKWIPPKLVTNKNVFNSALFHAVSETWDGLVMTVVGMKLLVQGRVSVRSLGGPIMIGQLAGQAAKHGPTRFIWIMGIISLNLGLLNLLPIPVLDGGQIVFIVLEAVTRRPLGRVLKERIMLVGVAMVLLLMVFTTWNDIARLLVG